MNKKEFLSKHKTFLYVGMIPFYISILSYILVLLLPIYRIQFTSSVVSFKINSIFENSNGSVLLFFGLSLVFIGCIVAYYNFESLVNAELKRLGVDLAKGVYVRVSDKISYILRIVVSTCSFIAGLAFILISPNLLAEENKVAQFSVSLDIGTIIPLCTIISTTFFSCGVRLYQILNYKKILILSNDKIIAK